MRVHSRERRRRSLERHAERQQAAEDHHRILGVEAAEELGGEAQAAEASVEQHRHAAQVDRDFARMQRALREPSRAAVADPHRRQRRAAGIALRELAAEGIADIDDDVLQIRNRRTGAPWPRRTPASRGDSRDGRGSDW